MTDNNFKEGDMKLKLYQIDAFTSRTFKGNPAAVCPLEQWPEDALLQAIAEENNLSETAYFVPSGKGFHLRWFTPVSEVNLCGHATLATAFVIFNIIGYNRQAINFETRSGDLEVIRYGDILIMDFPARSSTVSVAPKDLIEGLGKEPIEVLASDDYIAVYKTEDDIISITPELMKLKKLDLRGVIITAPGKEVDFVSRFFAPKYGIDEDPVTGSAHCELAPYWSAKLGKKRLKAHQLSKRGGTIFCELNKNRVLLSGKAVKFMEGDIDIADIT